MLRLSFRSPKKRQKTHGRSQRSIPCLSRGRDVLVPFGGKEQAVLDHESSPKTKQGGPSASTYIYIYIPGPSNRSLLEAFVDLKVTGGDLLEGPGMYYTYIHTTHHNTTRP